LLDVSSQIHTPAAAPTEITHGTQWVGSWVGPSAILRVLEKRKTLPFSGIGTSDRSVRRLITTPTMLPGTDIDGKIKLKFWYYEWRGSGI